MRDSQRVTMENVQIIFRNFSGKEGMYNREGDRNFCVILSNDVAAQMLRDGWNVKELEPRDEGDEPTPYLPVTVNFRNIPPKVVMITSNGRTILGEDQVELLDWADILNVDLIVTPYEWHVNGRAGVKAYLKTMYITIEEDELELKYSNVG